MRGQLRHRARYERRPLLAWIQNRTPGAKLLERHQYNLLPGAVMPPGMGLLVARYAVDSRKPSRSTRLAITVPSIEWAGRNQQLRLHVEMHSHGRQPE